MAFPTSTAHVHGVTNSTAKESQDIDALSKQGIVQILSLQNPSSRETNGTGPNECRDVWQLCREPESGESFTT